MAILFVKQYGDTVMIATDQKITLIRDTKDSFGFLTCHIFDPERFDFSAVHEIFGRAGREDDNNNARPNHSH